MKKSKPDMSSLSFIHRFGDSYDEFVQVLIDKFTLSREGNGKCLEFEITNNHKAIRDPQARYLLNNFIHKQHSGNISPIVDKLKTFEKDKSILSYHFEDSHSPFRYANGGVLPIIKIKKKDYFCLFYRAVFPVGWNIANGAANNIDDIRNPVNIIHREFSEEFIIADHKNRALYIYDADNEQTMSGTQEKALELWNKKLKKYNLNKYKRRSIPLKWIEGEDKLKLGYGSDSFAYDGFFVNITPDDNAIEIDKIALINLLGSFSFYDGEIDFIKDKNGNSEGFVLDRIIGFFPVKPFLRNIGNNRFEPEFFYYSGEKYPGKEFKTVLKKDYIERHRNIGFRTKKQQDKYLDAVRKKQDMDLCPITRAVAEKYKTWLKAEKDSIEIKSKLIEEKNIPVPPGKGFQIFISFKSKDQAIADLLFDYLTKRKYSVFCSSKSIRILGESEYAKAINLALEQAKVLIVIGSDLECFESGWVDYEWTTFLMLLLSKDKKGALFTLTQNINPRDLPLGLRTRENIPITNNSLEVSFDNLLGYIRNAMQR
jgi:hypothetical protein